MLKALPKKAKTEEVTCKVIDAGFDFLCAISKETSFLQKKMMRTKAE
jgi:hypothetical protein